MLRTTINRRLNISNMSRVFYPLSCHKLTARYIFFGHLCQLHACYQRCLCIGQKLYDVEPQGSVNFTITDFMGHEEGKASNNYLENVCAS